MSTRSMIALQTENAIEAVYCHSSGAPDHHLPILTGHYATDAAVAALMDLGDLSVLGPELGREHGFGEHGKTPETKNWCLAYGRDRGETDVAKRVYATEDAFLEDALGNWADYVYIFRAGRWLYRHARSGEAWCEANG